MKKNKTILITGGAGYIGSHTVYRLINKGYKTIVIDDFSTGHHDFIHPESEVIECDLKDYGQLQSLSKNISFDRVIHFASKSIVPHSMSKPFLYLEDNIMATINLLKLMSIKGSNNIIFSSSAAVFGIPESPYIDDNHDTSPVNPYGASKLVIEEILKSLFYSNNFNSISFRYFNAVGSDYKNNIGESHEPETHLIPNILNSILLNSSEPSLKIFGNDYPTHDGSCIRDYINVMDIAEAHIKGMEWLETNKGFHKMNLGTGQGCSVLEIIEVCEKITNQTINFSIEPRRQGDPHTLVANAYNAAENLNWKPQISIEESIIEAYEWAKLKH
jgi:UDP-glucose 4-epimerase